MLRRKIVDAVNAWSASRIRSHNAMLRLKRTILNLQHFQSRRTIVNWCINKHEGTHAERSDADSLKAKWAKQMAEADKKRMISDARDKSLIALKRVMGRLIRLEICVVIDSLKHRVALYRRFRRVSSRWILREKSLAMASMRRNHRDYVQKRYYDNLQDLQILAAEGDKLRLSLSTRQRGAGGRKLYEIKRGREIRRLHRCLFNIVRNSWESMKRETIQQRGLAGNTISRLTDMMDRAIQQKKEAEHAVQGERSIRFQVATTRHNT